MLIIGKITGFHGLGGEIKVPYSERLINNLNCLSQVYVFKTKSDYELLDITNFRIHKSNILIKFKQYSTKTDIEHLKGSLLKQKQENLAPLQEEEYFIKDLIGLNVYDQNETKIGIVNTLITETNSNDLIEITTLNNNISLIPFIEKFVTEVDIKNKRLRINTIPGLIDDEI
jgi:16S rRNA processing protein RimM